MDWVKGPSEETRQDMKKRMEFLFFLCMLAHMEKKEWDDFHWEHDSVEDAGWKDCYGGKDVGHFLQIGWTEAPGD